MVSIKFKSFFANYLNKFFFDTFNIMLLGSIPDVSPGTTYVVIHEVKVHFQKPYACSAL